MSQIAAKRTTMTLAALASLGVGILDSGRVLAGERHTTASTQAIGQPSPPHSHYDEDIGSSGAIASYAVSEAGAGFAESTSLAGFKTVKVFALSSKLGGTAGGHGDGHATASSSEKLTFSTSQVPAGEAMWVEITVGVSGDLTGNATCGQGQTAWQAGGVFTLYYGDNGLTEEFQVAFGEIDNDPDSPNITFENGEVTVQILWSNGAEFDLMMHSFAWSNITALGACTGEAKSALADSFTWKGVTSVTDSKGNPITQYTLVDEFGNDWTTPPSIADITFDGQVDVSDLLAVINAWGPCPEPCPPSCAADIAPPGGDCAVNVIDLLMVINNWGS